MDRFIVFLKKNEFHIIDCDEGFLKSLKETMTEVTYEKINSRDEIIDTATSIMKKIEMMLPDE